MIPDSPDKSVPPIAGHLWLTDSFDIFLLLQSILLRRILYPHVSHAMISFFHASTFYNVHDIFTGIHPMKFNMKRRDFLKVVGISGVTSGLVDETIACTEPPEIDTLFETLLANGYCDSEELKHIKTHLDKWTESASHNPEYIKDVKACCDAWSNAVDGVIQAVKNFNAAREQFMKIGLEESLRRTQEHQIELGKYDRGEPNRLFARLTEAHKSQCIEYFILEKDIRNKIQELNNVELVKRSENVGVKEPLSWVFQY